MSDILINAKLTWQVFLKVIVQTSARYIFVVLFGSVLFTLQWLFNIDQLREIVFGNSGLTLFDRIDFLANGFINIFKFADDFVPIAIICIALLQATTLTLLIRFNSIKKVRAQQSIPLGLSFLGAGCVACGGSMLTPILGLVASSVSVSFAERLSELLLIIALVVSYISVRKISFMVAQKI